MKFYPSRGRAPLGPLAPFRAEVVHVTLRALLCSPASQTPGMFFWTGDCTLMPSPMTAEHVRLVEAQERRVPWKLWGPYFSERAWGTVARLFALRTAWRLSSRPCRSRAYRWDEDGLGGICDRRQFVCFAVAFWNGQDPILKERLFGLTGNEGKHGEDVKEYCFYLDSTPTHSYMKYLYKYPQRRFPTRR